jgi:hypothetical protein
MGCGDMTITIHTPDGSQFNFPDGTTSDVIIGALGQHFGKPPTTEQNQPSSGAQKMPPLLSDADVGLAAPAAPPVKQAMSWQDDPIIQPASQLGTIARGPAPVLALCQLLVKAGHDPVTPLEAWRGDVLCLRIGSIGAAARLRVSTHGGGFELLPGSAGSTGASPVRENAAPPWSACRDARTRQ